jgi:excinuclease ABC subunit A
VVFTGLSGSGKSSLAFDTIYAEGQRRYVESLSAYARQFLEMMQKPDVDQIDGLSPAISIEQKTTSRNPRSTVGTVTEIYDYMRLLWARVGVPYSPATGLPIESQTVSQMVDRVWRCRKARGFICWRRWCAAARASTARNSPIYLKKGYQRVKIDGKFYEIAEAPALDKKFTHDIDVVVDRIVVRPISPAAGGFAGAGAEARRGAGGDRYRDAPRRPPSAGQKGYPFKQRNDDKSGPPKRLVFSEKFACPVSGFTIPEIEPRLFSFNNPFGACPKCGGLGVEQHIDADLVIPDKERTLRKGAIAPWAKSSSPYYIQTLTALGKHYKFTLDTKWKDLPKKTQDAILYGSGEDRDQILLRRRRARLRHQEAVRRRHHQSRAPLRETDSEWAREETRALFHRRAVRGLPRLPAQAGSAVRQDRRQAYRRSLRNVGRRAANGSALPRRR